MVQATVPCIWMGMYRVVSVVPAVVQPAWSETIMLMCLLYA